MEKTTIFSPTFEYKVIYVFRIPDGKQHRGCLKIGDATLHTTKPYSAFAPKCHELNAAAKDRIDSYTSTAGIRYDLLYTEIAVYKNEKGQLKAFRDHKVHDVLKRSGIKIKRFETNKIQNEWFCCDLNTAKEAIKAVKEGKSALNSVQITSDQDPISLRPEQKAAIKKTITRFKSDTEMLWNAKMRFGKTLTALQVAREMGFKRTIIITHRPVVSEGWFEDFGKIFYDRSDYSFGSKTKGRKLEDLLKCDSNFVYFASMQDLRGSDKVGGSFDKNDDVFNIDWDFVVVDEAHEGTKTKLGKSVLEAVIKKEKDDTHKTYVLELSGTPFNLLADFEQESIFTWDYIMEQEAKTTWDKYHFGDSNPYEELPRMNIFTYHLEKSLPVYIDVMDKAFNFREFFKIWTGDMRLDGSRIPSNANKGDFVHEADINSFLDLICKKDDNTNYPFSTNEYRRFFRHSLWVLPGVKEAKALSALLKRHHIFKNFTIVNVAGDGDEEIDTSDALNAVKNAMGDNPGETYTITLSCGRLTTGVSVPEWTAVLMLSGTESTAASQYLQTIFRVQTPANIDGKIKEECFVFDFAPDRTLKMVAESVQLSARAGSNNPAAELALSKFLNYCPVISIDESSMKEYKASELLQELKKAYAERVARNGFDDPKIYNDQLLKLSEVELKDFENLKKIVGNTKQTKKLGNIDINKEGFSQEELERENELEKKPKKELIEEEKAELEEQRKRKKNRESAISILRAISIRMPLLVYGMDIDIKSDVTIDNFADLIDDVSWEEFMPRGVDKQLFKKFSKYYDKDIFVAASRRIRYIAKTADELEPTERTQKIAELFSTFKNPDKETVLTPWRVVNMHLSQTIGGYCFYDEEFNTILDRPRFVDKANVTKGIFAKPEEKILEINSKTGLYPLYATYSIYRSIVGDRELDFNEKLAIWDKVVFENIYVICKTPMAKSITRRTLLGYRKGKINAHAFDDLVNQMKEKRAQIIQKIKSPKFWNKGGKEMKFDAIVGNPPYNEMDGGAQSSSTPLYQYFVETAISLSPNYISMIIPSRWMIGGKKILDDFRKKILFDRHFLILHDYKNANDCFSNVDIKGGVCYFLWDKGYNGKCSVVTHSGNDEIKSFRFLKENDCDIFIRDESLISVMNKVKSLREPTFDSIVSARKPYGLVAETMLSASKFGLPEFTSEKIDGGFEILGLGKKMKRVWKYLPRNYPIPKRSPCLEKFKVFIAEAYGCGALGEVPSELVLGEPGQLCTETFLEIGPFNTAAEAANAIKYIKTKFFRCLVSIQKQTQHTTQKVYRFVPLQVFTSSSDIDWTKPIADLDKQLFHKYNLNAMEINFINANVREMN